MKEQPPFSIITVVYNDADNLEKSIKSLIGQSIKDYEYIVIDGGSSDSTLEVIKKYESHISYWKSEKDKGIYDAMNKGIKAAKGKFIHFLNAGDTYSGPDLLQSVYKEMANFSAVEIFYGKTIYKGDGSFNIKGNKLNFWNVYFSIPFCHQSMFFKKSLFEENGLYDTTYKFAADYAWMSKYLEMRKDFRCIKFIDKPISVYLDGGASFVNIEKVIGERKRIARSYFPPLPYFAFLFFTPFIHVKTFLLKVMIRMQILSHYRRIKHRFSNHSNITSV